MLEWRNNQEDMELELNKLLEEAQHKWIEECQWNVKWNLEWKHNKILISKIKKNKWRSALALAQA